MGAEVALDGQTTADELFDRMADSVFTLAARILSDIHEAEDVVQSTFEKVQRKLGTFRGEGTIEAWVHRIAYNESVGTLRSRKFRPADPEVFLELRDEAETPEQAAVSRDVNEAMESALASLSATLRAAFVLRDIQLLTTAEVALVLGASESAVKMRLARARAAVRNSMRGYL